MIIRNRAELEINNASIGLKQYLNPECEKEASKHVDGLIRELEVKLPPLYEKLEREDITPTLSGSTGATNQVPNGWEFDRWAYSLIEMATHEGIEGRQLAVVVRHSRGTDGEVVYTVSGKHVRSGSVLWGKFAVANTPGRAVSQMLEIAAQLWEIEHREQLLDGDICEWVDPDKLYELSYGTTRLWSHFRKKMFNYSDSSYEEWVRITFFGGRG